jgi:hypothetical protein
MLGQYTLNDATHLIQVALTPVFLLSGIGALLNVSRGGWRGWPTSSRHWTR